jgi:cobalt-zinc-cadmium efflux system outer membrane protein
VTLKFKAATISIFLSAFAFFLLFGCAGPAFAEGPAQATPVQQLVDEAVRNNPGLKMLEEKIGAYSERPSQAESLDNPRIGFSIMSVPVDTFRFDQEPMTQKQISLWQKLPFPGKLGLKGDIARKETEVVKEEFDEKKNSLIMQVSVTYRNLLFINKSIKVAEENRDLLRNFVKIAETRYAVGMGIQQDVLKAQVEVSKINDQLISLEQRRKSEIAHLNTLLNRPVDTPFSPGEELPDGKVMALSLSAEQLQAIALENRPSLLGLQRLVERQRLAERFAEKNYYPDFDVGVSYGLRENAGTGENRPDFVSGYVTVSIPLWYRTKERKKVAEEKANVRNAIEEYNSAKNDVFFQIKDILTDIERYDRQIGLFKTGLIPQSKTSLESAMSGYQVNKVDFITLVNNELTLYNYEIDYYRSITSYMNKLSELEAAVGKQLF